MQAVPAVVLGLASAVAMAALTPSVLRRLPEPRETDELPDDAPAKLLYADLAATPFTVGLAVLSGSLVAGAAWWLPGHALPEWVVLAMVGLLLAGIDARTTWLPLVLTRAAWGLAALAAAVGAVIAGSGWFELTWRTVAGAAIATALFGLVWWMSRGGLGFGDVRYAPLVGAAAGSAGWSFIWSALVLGAIVGGLWGAVRLVRRRRGAFAYAPSMFAGAWLALGSAGILS